MDIMCPDGLNKSLWEMCVDSALENKRWAESQIDLYPDYQTNEYFSDIGRAQITHFKDTSLEILTSEKYQFLLMMARSKEQFKIFLKSFDANP